MYALDSNGIHDGSYIYSTWYDDLKLTKAFLTTGLDLGNTLQLIFAVLLLILGVIVAIQGVKKLFEKTDDVIQNHQDLQTAVL